MIHGEEEEARSMAHLPILVAGNYCHDTIINPASTSQTLGGSSSYIANVLGALALNPLIVISKVGSDFAYRSHVSHAPITIPSTSTTHFIADYTQGERRLRADKLCQPIRASDLPEQRYVLGLAVGVAGEITVEALERMVELCDRVIVDIQALIREIDPACGDVKCRKLEETGFQGLLHRISFLKASKSEVRFVDVESVRMGGTCVIVTDGDKGSTVYHKSGEFHVPALPAVEVDPTGAGDSFLGGFVAGLQRGLAIDRAVLLGNYFGALAVGQVGVPRLTQLQIQESHKFLVGKDGMLVEACSCTKAVDAGQQQRHCLVCTSQ